MPSGQFGVCLTSDVLIPARIREVNDTQPQSLEHGDRSLEALGRSLEIFGQIHPILLTQDMELVAGFRRLTATQALSRAGKSIRGLLPDRIHYQFANEVSAEERTGLELEENAKRLDMSWEEKAKGVKAYHEAMKKLNPAWTQDLTGEALNISQSQVQRYLTIVDAIAAKPALAKSKTLNAAVQRARADNSRLVDSYLAENMMSLGVDPSEPAPEPPAPRAKAAILNEDFHTWLSQYSGPPFDVIHCDFPYGINIDKSRLLSSQSHINNKYSDSPDIYFALLNTFVGGLQKFAAFNSNIIFWFSMQYYTETREIFQQAGCTVQRNPLIWHKSCGTGFVVDVDRTPKHVYETALIISRGDRKTIRPVADVYAAPKPGNSHMSLKPVPMLRHFLSMFVDPGTTFFDPTCGSGSSVRAALLEGARSSLGLEIDPQVHASAADQLKIELNKIALQEMANGK